MSQFAERAARHIETPQDRLAQIVSNAARSSWILEADRISSAAGAKRRFSEAGLSDFLDEAVGFAREQDGFRDATLEYSLEEFRLGSTPLGMDEDHADVMHAILTAKTGSFSFPVAELRFNNQPGKAAKGYSFVKILLFREGNAISIEGKETKLLLLRDMDKVKDAIYEAYQEPGIVLPMDVAPDDQASPEDPTKT